MSVADRSKACLHKALDTLLPSPMLLLKQFCSPALLCHLNPPPPETVLDIQSMKLHCCCALGLIKLLLSSLLLYVSPFMLCMLRHTVPSLHDAVLSEKQVKGGSNVLKVCLSGLLLSMLHSLACCHNTPPRL